ncbi:hypothetical protein [Streptomyces sp. NBRC 109706]|uniref:hypothetical protein n=1 Tax=Streptomyces sp. NBRC 109706 TaxID=1550035 RepID=UPI0007822368|nr:hypothetical protein [Streptomyces sp. NBRC 109706]
MSEPQLNLTNLPNTNKPKTTTTGGGKAKPGRGPAWDWAAGHGPVSGAISATTGAGAAALLGAATGAPEVLPLAIGAAGAIGHGIGASIRRRLTLRTASTRVASWLLAGGWTTWAMTTGPLSWAAAGTLTALGVGIGAAASSAATWEEAAETERLTAEAAQAARELNRDRLAIAQEWEERIARVCRINLRIFAVENWPTGAGYSLAAELPGGATFDQIEARARQLAGDARLPLGCTVTVEEGDLQGRAVIDVATRNVMGQTVAYPTPYTPLSILTGIPWGVRPIGEEIRVYLREACALILGPPGSGKSTFTDAVLAGFARCVDVLTFVIDLKAGAVGMPWVRPWLEAEGHVAPLAGAAPAPAGTRPGIDWLASTPEEAIVMLKAVLAICSARQQQYQQLLAENNTSLLPVSSQIPQIMVVVDEGAEALAATFKEPRRKELGDLIRQGMRTTRAMGGRFVLTAVDGNVSAIGDTQVRKFSPVGVALTSGETVSNLGKLFPRARVDTRQLSQKGAGVIGDAGADGFAPTPFKGWMTGPTMVRDVVLATNDTRPRLDEISARAAGAAYSERWSAGRAGWLWANTPQPAPRDAPFTPQENPQPPASGPAEAGLNLSYKRTQPPTPDHTQADADEMAARLLAEIDAQFGTTTEPDRTTGPSGKGLNLSYKRAEQAAPETESPQSASAGPEWLPDAIQAIYAAGSDGMKPGAIADQVGRDRKTVRDTLKAAASRGELVYRDRGPHSVYVHPDHA